MAKMVKTWLTDDFESASGKEVEANQTVPFSLDGHDYEIDLSNKNATKMRNDIEQWSRYARVVGGKRKYKISPKVAAAMMGKDDDGMDVEQRRAAREWLRNNTEEWKDLGNRGRIPAEALAVFHARPAVAAVEFSSAGV